MGAVGTTGCKCSAAYKGDMVSACQTCQNQQKTGNFALASNPSAYLQCSVQGPFISRCNGRLKWNQKLQNCV